MTTSKPFIDQALAAIHAKDAETLELLRDNIRPEHVPLVVNTWRASMPWPLKDGYATLLMDQVGPVLEPLMTDALDSPTAETRAYALCSLTGNFELFDSLLTSGGVDPQKVDAAVGHYRAAVRPA